MLSLQNNPKNCGYCFLMKLYLFDIFFKTLQQHFVRVKTSNRYILVKLPLKMPSTESVVVRRGIAIFDRI